LLFAYVSDYKRPYRADRAAAGIVDTVTAMTWKIAFVVALAVVVILGCVWEWRNRRPRTHGNR